MTLLDFAGLAAALSFRVRSSNAAILMERAALLRTLTALDEIEQDWQAHLARASKLADGGVDLVGLLTEMLSVDVLLRTWAAFVASSVDSGRHPLRSQGAAAILTRMLLQQRRRLLLTLIDARLSTAFLQRIDKHRRICERWSDVLLSVFPATSTTRALKFDIERSSDFNSLWPSLSTCVSRAAEPVVITALRSALPPMSLEHSPRREACSQLAEAIAAALRFDRRSLAAAVQA